MGHTSSDPTRWAEPDSARFAELGDIYVPDREEQRRVLLDLIPADKKQRFQLVELSEWGRALPERPRKALEVVGAPIENQLASVDRTVNERVILCARKQMHV